jgi:short subunit fatty acids transporter
LRDLLHCRTARRYVGELKRHARKKSPIMGQYAGNSIIMVQIEAGVASGHRYATTKLIAYQFLWMCSFK